MDAKTECLEVQRWENEGGQPLIEVETKRARNFEFQMKGEKEVHHEYAYIRKGKDQK